MFDRRGTVVFWDDFEYVNATRWYLIADGVGSLAISNDRSWMGDYSMKMVTAAGLGNGCSMYKAFSVPFSGRMGAEIMFNIQAGSPQVQLRIMGYSGSVFFSGGLRYNTVGTLIQYQSQLLLFSNLTLDDSFNFTHEQWVPMKIVVDWDSSYYIRGLFAGTEYDLSSYSLPHQGDATLQRLLVEVDIYNGNADSSTVYIDNVIFTQNE